ncbi:MAG TPA: hypothetical protein DCL41_08455, partial [Bdellovibrionales bacterium]|nr:hypothetical protein [Bdellovibrionales bacterium]
PFDWPWYFKRVHRNNAQPPHGRLEWDFLPLPDFLYIPKSFNSERTPMTDRDYEAALKSLNESKREVHYIDVYDEDNNLIFKSELTVGESTEVNPYESIKKMILKLREEKIPGNQKLIIKDAHTHPWIIGRSLFSPADVKAHLAIHSILELSGYRNFTYESSILFFKFTKLDYVKKTISTSTQNISYFRGEFSVGKKLDAKIRALSLEELEDFVNTL